MHAIKKISHQKQKAVDDLPQITKKSQSKYLEPTTSSCSHTKQEHPFGPKPLSKLFVIPPHSSSSPNKNASAAAADPCTNTTYHTGGCSCKCHQSTFQDDSLQSNLP